MGIKIAGNDLQKAVAGTSLMVLHPEDEIEDLKEEVMKDLESVMSSMTRQSKGVFVQASTLGACAACAYAHDWGWLLWGHRGSAVISTDGKRVLLRGWVGVAVASGSRPWVCGCKILAEGLW